jgi:hypothetical protein
MELGAINQGWQPNDQKPASVTIEKPSVSFAQTRILPIKTLEKPSLSKSENDATIYLLTA